MICVGIDSGSRTLKVVLLERATSTILDSVVLSQGIDHNGLAEQALDDLLERNELTRDDLTSIVATGYGRKVIHFADQAVTEITCQRWGVRHVAADARTIIDIGGQDSKLLHLGDKGTIEDFSMNDRCAAGTGRFLEVAAVQLGMDLDAFGVAATRSKLPASISSMCVVFAETEIIGLLASNTPCEDIAAGIQSAIAARLASMSISTANSPIIFTGGVALVPGMREALQTAFGRPVATAETPQLTAAIGAALIASDQPSKKVSEQSPRDTSQTRP